MLYVSGCPYNAAYYNVYNVGDGLGWHFDRSEFGVNIELEIPTATHRDGGSGDCVNRKTIDGGGQFEISLHTRSNENPWNFHKVQDVLRESSTAASSTASSSCSKTSSSSTTTPTMIQTIQYPTIVGPGSLVIFSGKYNLHRVTPVVGVDDDDDDDGKLSGNIRRRRVNAILTYERTPNVKTNPYSLRKFFGRY